MTLPQSSLGHLYCIRVNGALKCSGGRKTGINGKPADLTTVNDRTIRVMNEQEALEIIKLESDIQWISFDNFVEILSNNDRSHFCF